jgi:UDP-N-acetylglucosamine--N-acetylmuramyl-(pentapeptide) pyrophosphoryl-undecaprenol N-acetylglucosamine transferase
LLICAGGTGGGVYPALAVLQALASNVDSILWVGGEEGMEANLVKQSTLSSEGKLSFATIPAAGVHGVGLRSLPRNLGQLARGLFASRRILQQFKPDVLFFTGGYLAVPMALAGRGIPSLSYVPDIEPGLALKTLASFSTRIALTTEESRAYFSSHARLSVTGYPVRSDLARWTRQEAHQFLGLKADLPVLLVTGGSKGARSINQALGASLPAILQKVQIVHLSGQLDWPSVQASQAALPPELQSRYHAFPYLHEMGAALASADLVISRAGASVLGEYPLFGLPAILVPYPYAWHYQKVNAEYLITHGAAIMIEDAKLTGQLLSTVVSLLEDAQRLASMRTAMLSLSRPQAAQDLASSLVDLANHSGRRE